MELGHNHTTLYKIVYIIDQSRAHLVYTQKHIICLHIKKTIFVLLQHCLWRERNEIEKRTPYAHYQ
jgi:hypothetical protein